jgi:hypothetical protein
LNLLRCVSANAFGKILDFGGLEAAIHDRHYPVVHQTPDQLEFVSPRVDDAAAAQVEERFTARIKAQQPQAGGETALRKPWLH